MEITTIIGIVVALVLMLVGIGLIFSGKKNQDTAEQMLNVNPDTQLPIIPRHLRLRLLPKQVPQASSEPHHLGNADALANSVTASSVAENPTAKNFSATHHVTAQPTSLASVAPPQLETVHTIALEMSAHSAAALHAAESNAAAYNATTSLVNPANSTISGNFNQSNTINSATAVNHAAPSSAAPSTTTSSDTTSSTTTSLATAATTTAQPENNASTFASAMFPADVSLNLLDAHLSEQQRRDSEADIANADHVITLKVMANPRRALSGDKALKVMLKYGLRYGELSCFHRHEQPDVDSALMFSVLRITDFGYAGFDLENLSTEQVQGLAFFMTFPHHQALTGFDMMSSIANLIANEIDGRVFDETHREYSPQLKLHWRNHVIDYMAQHAN